jgi:flagellar protein FliO/FliZ
MALTGLKTVFALVLVIALMFALAWALKRYGPLARARKSFGLTVIGQVALGSKANLALIRVGRSILLLGVTQDSINLLKDLDEGDFEKSLSEVSPHRGT